MVNVEPTAACLIFNMINIIHGNLLEADDKYIAHQTNCITNRAAHLSAAVFASFHHADCYTGRATPDAPGTISVRGNGSSERFVINMFGQYYPGKPKYPSSTLDGGKVREKYFYYCLLDIAKIKDLQSIGFPYRVGCGAAGGDWINYLSLLKRFAQYITTQNVKVSLYCLSDQDFETAQSECRI